MFIGFVTTFRLFRALEVESPNRKAMIIVIREANDSGSGYPFTLSRWLTGELIRYVGRSDLFEQEHGKDWTLIIQLFTNTRLKKPKIGQPDVHWKKQVCYIV